MSIRPDLSKSAFEKYSQLLVFTHSEVDPMNSLEGLNLWLLEATVVSWLMEELHCYCAYSCFANLWVLVFAAVAEIRLHYRHATLDHQLYVN